MTDFHMPQCLYKDYCLVLMIFSELQSPDIEGAATVFQLEQRASTFAWWDDNILFLLQSGTLTALSIKDITGSNLLTPAPPSFASGKTACLLTFKCCTILSDSQTVFALKVVPFQGEAVNSMSTKPWACNLKLDLKLQLAAHGGFSSC